MQHDERPAAKLRVCGFTLSRRLLTLSASVLVLHTSVSVLEEGFFAGRSFPGFHHGFVLSWLSFTLMSAMTIAYVAARELAAGRRLSGLAALTLSEARRIRANAVAVRGLTIVFFCYATSTSLSRVSLAYVSMPMMLVLKSAKILPVMAAGVFITGRRYGAADYISAGMLAAGVALFSGAGGNASAVSGDAPGAPGAGAVTFGAALLGAALCCDALLGNYQERVMRDSGVSPLQMMLLQAVFSGCLALAVSAASGELRDALPLLAGPLGARLARSCVVYAACLLAGTVAVLSLVEEAGAAVAVTITLLRKVASMGCSYVLYPKPLSALHVWGAALVFASPLAHSWVKARTGGKGGGGKGGGGGGAAAAPAAAQHGGGADGAEEAAAAHAGAGGSGGSV